MNSLFFCLTNLRRPGLFPVRFAASVLTLTTALACTVGQQGAIAASTVLADSVNDFSDVQGQDGWWYGYYATPGDSSSFQPLPVVSNTPYDGSVWGGLYDSNNVYHSPWLSQSQGAPKHSVSPPGSPVWPVRRWQSTYSGLVNISGELEDVNSHDDGTVGRILINGIAATGIAVTNTASGQITPATDAIASVAGDLLRYSWEGTIDQGQWIDFALDPNSNPDHDSTRFTATLQSVDATAVPTPALLPGLLGFGFKLVRKRRQLLH